MRHVENAYNKLEKKMDVDGSIMETFKERLTTEMQELNEKIDKLQVFINSEDLHNIDATQQVLLRIQYQSMITYFQVLVERIAWLDRN
jgi:uncharacterized membrane protein (DUF106 family)